MYLLPEPHGHGALRLISSPAHGLSATPPGLLRSGSGRGTDLTRAVELDEHVGDGVLHIAARAASCDAEGPDGTVAEGAACHLHQQDWGVPVRVTPSGESRLVLPL